MKHELHFDRKDFPGAIAAYQDVITRFPESPEAAEAQFRIANIYHWDLVEPEKAVQEYQKMIDNYPTNEYAIEALVRLGEVFARLNQFDKALSYIQQVIDKHPQSDYVPWAKLRKANLLYFDFTDEKVAEPIYQELLRDYSSTEYAAEARLWLTRIQQEHGGHTLRENRSLYEQIIADYPEYPSVQAQAQYMIGRCLALEGRWEEAITAYERVITQYPDVYKDLHVLASIAVAELYVWMSNADKAIERFQLTAAQHPKSIWVPYLQLRINSLANANLR